MIEEKGGTVTQMREMWNLLTNSCGSYKADTLISAKILRTKKKLFYCITS